jgi:hypothetical protein
MLRAVSSDPKRAPEERSMYESHLDVGRRSLSRWRGGESHSALADAMRAEIFVYETEQLRGVEADVIRYFFRKLCRSLEIGVSPSAS